MIDALAGRLGLALAIGLLVGLERGWRERNAADRTRTAGIRTYGISGLLGGVTALLSIAMDAPSIFATSFLVFGLILTVYMLREAVADNNFSVTATLSGLAVFGLGALAVAGDHMVAAAGGTALAAVLASRDLLHRFLKRLSWEELRAALILAAMTAIVLPLLPNYTIDPWNGVNPRQIWVFTILVATLSYAGYVATRLLGSGRGLLLTSLLGAIVSSTAVTVALARRTQVSQVATVGAAALAAAVSICRVCLIVAMVGPTVLVHVALSALSAAATFVIVGVLLLLRGRSKEVSDMEVTNPFELMPLLAFAAGFAAVAAASAYLTDVVGVAGMLVASTVSGLVDVDVAVLNALRLTDAPQATAPGATSAIADAILLALLANTGGRVVLSAFAGRWQFSMPYLLTSLLAAGVGVTVYTI